MGLGMGRGAEEGGGRGGRRRGKETYVGDVMLVGAIEEFVQHVDARFGLDGHAG